MSLFKRDKTKKEAVATVAAEPVKEVKSPKASYVHEGRVLLKKPWTSEKAYGLHSKNQYVFLVDIKAKKNEIRKEVARHYNVKVLGVNVLVKKGKTKRLGRNLGQRSDLKKAIVTLAAGNKIEIT